MSHVKGIRTKGMTFAKTRNHDSQLCTREGRRGSNQHDKVIQTRHALAHHFAPPMILTDIFETRSLVEEASLTPSKCQQLTITTEHWDWALCIDGQFRRLGQELQNPQTTPHPVINTHGVYSTCNTRQKEYSDNCSLTGCQILNRTRK